MKWGLLFFLEFFFSWRTQWAGVFFLRDRLGITPPDERGDRKTIGAKKVLFLYCVSSIMMLRLFLSGVLGDTPLFAFIFLSTLVICLDVFLSMIERTNPLWLRCVFGMG
ncbi:hypothetical protein SODALDRAFT_45023 [Sodiomyces alkalinus F11]|uniref:Uncharacterized protein n=1 Tax=Sodiomyces alkalinus (strain CBS 110278 / VKM F-3762 / F11) TaxID=1314773 RepID=A0A3N2QAC6_SODAK|nr:hypothetical protein SODALDRAFT_45023 [Sodiomyces alkalinus F11]ROT43700.1 hypothetical protein SODALDRAFT_45023 [Sodiomyces alkalinus F11]